MSMRLLMIAFAALVGGALVAGAVGRTQAKAPAIRYVDDKFGPILATPTKRALYYWNVEKRANGKIKCTRSCAKAWPPLYAKGAVPRHVAGIKGIFGTVRRPDGRRQVTFNGLAVYTYAHEGPTQVLCDNVGGWFVVRLK